ncbi:MAG TPA: restriction endonuclease, partial [Pseudoxanthomonas sp.]|nr:restriction endonuclease [Pseudoxanthomonas sp.]
RAEQTATGLQIQQPATAEVPDGSAVSEGPLRLQRPGHRLMVLCVHGQPPPVGADQVQALLKTLGEDAHDDATAVLITAGEFDEAALEVASGSDRLQLIDGTALRAMMGPVPEPSGSRLPPPLPLNDEFVARRPAWLRYRGTRLGALLATWGPRQWTRAVVPMFLLLAAAWGYPQYLASQARQARQEAQASARRPVFVEPAVQAEAAPAAKERLTGLWNPLPIRPVAERQPRPRPAQDAAPEPALVRLTDSNVWTEQELQEWRRRQEESIRTLEGSTSASPL